ncbi:MAG TPA: gamma-glutamyltransferase [Candidatus Saccharimonadales bacterium]|nr:gamma-glutamyltransferase [Candidatus Saccharimonadales bacterium]
MAFLFLGWNASGENRPIGRHFVTRSEVIARHGMACTSQPLATQAAVEILKQGGSAVDAAIAANAVLGLVEPENCGVGGDLFAIVWDAAGQKLHGLNGSGRSPAGLSLAELRAREVAGKKLERIPERGPLSVSVPGCVDGWFELHRKFGRLPMKQILGPAISYAREGFGVSEVIADEWANASALVSDQPGFAAVYLPDHRPPAKGQVFRNPALADTLERIGEGGREAFYEGPIAQALAAFLHGHGGFLTARDLAAHHAEWVEPISANYRGYDVWELPPNTQGLAALEMLNVLEGLDLAHAGFGSADHVHWFIEAKKLAFEDRAKYIADPAAQPHALPVRLLTSKPYAEQRRRLLSREKAAKAYEAGDPRLNQGDTVYLTTADDQGNMVSWIQSLYLGFGSGVTPETLGFALQNRGTLFSLQEGEANTYAPGKRPFHTIIPAFITKEGRPWISFGVMGGQMQPQGHVQIVLNLIDFGMGLQEAGDAPRIQHHGSSEPTGTRMTDGGQVYLETGFAPETERNLVKRGHKVGRTSASSFGGYQAIRVDLTNHVYFGASESRKDGQAAGY